MIAFSPQPSTVFTETVQICPEFVRYLSGVCPGVFSMNAAIIPLDLPKNTDEAPKKTTAPAARKRKKLPFSMYQDGPTGTWHFSKMIKGRRIKASLHTPDRALAEARGWDKFNKVTAEKYDLVDKQANRAGWARLSEIGAAYLENPVVIAKAATRRRNWHDLLIVARETHGSTAPETLSSEILTKQTAFKFFGLRLRAAELAHPADLLKIESAKRSANQTFTNARCLFSQRAMEGYGELKLPGTVAEFARATKLATKRQPRPVKLEDDFVQGVIVAAAELKTADPGAWVAFWLMIGGGFRNVEALHARTGWFMRKDWGYRVALEQRSDFMPKGTEGEVVLPLAVMDEVLALPRSDDFIVPASSATDRHRAIYRRLNAWLTARGVNAEAGKVAYRLRKYFVEMVRQQMGAAAAQIAARHASARTTAGHYLSAQGMDRPIDLSATAGIDRQANKPDGDKHGEAKT